MSRTLDAKDLLHRAAGLAAAITEYFLIHNDACTVKELAAHMKRSESYVRKVLAECQGCPRGCVIADGQREKFSTAYRSMPAGYSRVDTYQPTMTHLRDMVLELRADLTAHKGQERKAV